RVITLGDLEQRIAQAPQEIAKAQQVAMVLCVGASQAGYCSRICCSTAMKNALKVKELNPQAQVYVLHKDIRTYGFKEALYTQAREKGVLFIRYAEETPPSLRDIGGELRLSATDPILKESLVLAPDLVVLATAIVPSAGAQELSTTLKLPLSREGFFLEAHMKLRPVDFASEGVFLCGSAHYPKFIEEAITQAAAAAARASAILSKEQLEVGGAVAQVESQKCAACLTCVRFCPYKAPFINREGVAEIQVALCQGCGICAAECPAKAIQLLHYKDAQVMAGTQALLEAVR
ncbi:MAG: 4Fe-4S binding protein, partial [Chloroflexota bacterium]|nr:4Fe-4S binding protein [Chloroflexota bacterium]